MPGPAEFLFLLSLPATGSSLPAPGLLAYVGLGPGQEFIPYFFGLVGFVGTVLLALLHRLIAVLLRWLPRVRRRPPAGGPKDEPVGAHTGDGG